MNREYFRNKVIWITGASSGIGEALVYQINRLKVNAKIILTSRNPEDLQMVIQKGNLNENNCLILPMDVCDVDRMRSAYEKVLAKFGRVDILINNAGISQRSKVIDTIISVDQKLINVNYLGAVALIKTVMPDMQKRQSGHIVNIASIAGVVATPNRSSYAATKHALIGFSDALRAEVYDDRIQVSVICPGYVNTNISINALTQHGQKQGTMDNATSKGMKASECAKRILKAVAAKKPQVYIAGPKEMTSIYLKKWAPGLLRLAIRKIKTV